MQPKKRPNSASHHRSAKPPGKPTAKPTGKYTSKPDGTALGKKGDKTGKPTQFRIRKKRKPKPTHEFTDAQRGERLQKVLASAGIASRRNCELLIEEGAVKVNGQVVNSLPAWVNPDTDHIEVDGRPIARHRKATGGVGKEGHVYIALHKPRDVFATTSDEFGRLTVIDLVDLPPLNPGDPSPRLFPVGRLDADATGLILLTNDGELAHRLTHPSFEIPKEYEVSVRGRVTQEDLPKLIEELKRGQVIAKGHLKRRSPAEKAAAAVTAKTTSAGELRIMGYQQDDEHGERTTLFIKLNEGPDREVKWVLKRMGFAIRRLKRIAIGPVKLKGIPIRGWRTLSTSEVQQLRREVGLKKEA